MFASDEIGDNHFCAVTAMNRSTKRGPVLWMAGVLIASASLWPATSGAQNFDCRSARSPDELTVCRKPALARLDQELASLQRHDMDKLTKESRQAFKENDILFVKARRRCGTSQRCIEQSYRNRINEFQDLTAVSRADEPRRGSRAAQPRAPEMASRATVTDTTSNPAATSATPERAEPASALPPKRQEKREVAVTTTPPAAAAATAPNEAPAAPPAPDRVPRATDEQLRQFNLFLERTGRSAQTTAQDRGRPSEVTVRVEPSLPAKTNAEARPKRSSQQERAATQAEARAMTAGTNEGSGGATPTIQWVNPAPASGR
jgi:uncharacterized protein